MPAFHQKLIPIKRQLLAPLNVLNEGELTTMSSGGALKLNSAVIALRCVTENINLRTQVFFVQNVKYNLISIIGLCVNDTYVYNKSKKNVEQKQLMHVSSRRSALR